LAGNVGLPKELASFDEGSLFSEACGWGWPGDSGKEFHCAKGRERRSLDKEGVQKRTDMHIHIAIQYTAMADPKLPVSPIRHECPICHHPQTKIQRRVSDDKLGSTNYVCSRASECCLGINLTKVETWVTCK
jgi:hypothetical protein